MTGHAVGALRSLLIYYSSLPPPLCFERGASSFLPLFSGCLPPPPIMPCGLQIAYNVCGLVKLPAIADMTPPEALRVDGDGGIKRWQFAEGQGRYSGRSIQTAVVRRKFAHYHILPFLRRRFSAFVLWRTCL
jgi:hypothetical protein